MQYVKTKTDKHKNIKYYVEMKEFSTAKMTDNIDDALNIIQKNICTKNIISNNKNRTNNIGYLKYKNQYIMAYSYDNNIVFNLHHIIALRDVEIGAYNNIYKKYKGKITSRCWVKNKYGGYIINEFIPRDVMFRILMDGRSIFCTKFKDDLSKLLDNLCKSNNLIINSDGEFDLHEDIKAKTIQVKTSKIIDQMFNNNKYDSMMEYYQSKSLIKSAIKLKQRFRGNIQYL